MNALILKCRFAVRETRLPLHLRAKTNFSRRINTIHPITPPVPKKPLSRSGKSAAVISAVPRSQQEERIGRSPRTLGAGCDGYG
jgi:hypothetical protein